MKKSLAASILGTASLGIVACTGGGASAADAIGPGLVGSWKLVSVYDQFDDGSKRSTWGADPQGLVVFTREGLFSATIVDGARTGKPGTVPTDPVGPAIAYFGSYIVDEGARTFVTKVWQSTFPQWQGVALQRTVEELNVDRLKVVAAPISDSTGRRYVPHLEFERVK